MIIEECELDDVDFVREKWDKVSDCIDKWRIKTEVRKCKTRVLKNRSLEKVRCSDCGTVCKGKGTCNVCFVRKCIPLNCSKCGRTQMVSSIRAVVCPCTLLQDGDPQRVERENNERVMLEVTKKLEMSLVEGSVVQVEGKIAYEFFCPSKDGTPPRTVVEIDIPGKVLVEGKLKMVSFVVEESHVEANKLERYEGPEGLTFVGNDQGQLLFKAMFPGEYTLMMCCGKRNLKKFNLRIPETIWTSPHLHKTRKGEMLFGIGPLGVEEVLTFDG